MAGPLRKTGTYRGQSNALGHGGRAAQLQAAGVPGGVIGELARKAGAAPGGPNYHGNAPDKGAADAEGKNDPAPKNGPEEEAEAMMPMKKKPNWRDMLNQGMAKK